MKLSLSRSFQSIRDFQPMETPDFVLITGPNGSGKSHLLTAISEGAVAVEGLSEPKANVRLFTWQTMVPQDQAATAGVDSANRIETAFRQYREQKAQFIEQVLAAARNAGVANDLLQDFEKLIALDEAGLVAAARDGASGTVLSQAVQDIVKRATTKIPGRMNQYAREFDAALRNSSKNALNLGRGDFEHLPAWGGADLFQQSFGELFASYRNLWLRNQLLQRAREKGKEGAAPLTDQEFDARYMVAPWTFVNEALDRANLPFEISRPDEFSFAPFQPRLLKRDSGAEIGFNDLSSGEKILMSLAFCVYYANDRRQVAAKPKLLLLDEVDAPLHPSMAKTFLQVITDTLVATHKIPVIAATHSASTVAMTPEESIYLMDNKLGGLKKISKAEALNRLTVDVPTLSIAFDERRQVFVESSIDARVYDAAYQSLRSDIGNGRSLQFMGTGVAKSGGDINNGCSVVRHLIETLEDAGNKTVFGLIDWDGENTPTSRVHVLAHARRNGLENVLLDPLLLSATILRVAPDAAASLGLNTRYADFLNAQPSELQEAVAKIERALFPSSTEKRVETQYAAGFSLQLSAAALTTDDHAYEQLVLDRLPSLKAISRGRTGLLMEHIAKTVLRDKPGFAPIELVDAFRQLLDAPTHS